MGSLGLGNGSLRMDDVYLSGSTPDGPAVVAHLSVIVDTEGITFLGPEPGERRTVGWDRTSPLEFGPPAELPGGEAVTSLEFVVDGRPLRLLVPTKKDPDQAADVVAPAGVPVASSTVVESPAPVAEPVAGIPVVELPVVDVPQSVVPVVESPVPESPPVRRDPGRRESRSSRSSRRHPVAENTLVENTRRPDRSSRTQWSRTQWSRTRWWRAQWSRTRPSRPPRPWCPPHRSRSPWSRSPRRSRPSLPRRPSLRWKRRSPIAHVDAPLETIETATAVPTVAPVVEEWLPQDDDLERPHARVWYQYAPRPPRRRFIDRPTSPERLVKLVVFTLLIGLIPIAAGLRYYQSYQPSGRITGVALSDAAIAARVGIQPGDLPGWSTNAPRMGNAFAAGATTDGPAALQTAEQASTIMARCLHVPVSAVAGAFGMGSAISQISAESTSPSYLDPAGNGGAVSSVVDVVKTPQVQQADSNVFQDPALFATCYQPFVQAMLPFAPGFGSTGFATATVQPFVVPVPEGPGVVQVAAFQIVRISNQGGQAKTVVSTATAVFDGRIQATLGTVTNFVFSLDAQNALVRDLETRVLGVNEL